ncbi:MAG: hypothetical protein N4Q30_02285 [Neisseriaceae bacterium]|nr:hypothetical protein [Neisseriaceae bacterium]
MRVNIQEIKRENLAQWVRLRQEIWPEDNDETHLLEGLEIIICDNFVSLLATDEQGNELGFVDGSIRHDYVNGCETSPVGFLEGVFVLPAYR